MSEHGFCRSMLTETMNEVRKRFTREEIKNAWVYNTGRTGGYSQWEFHGPNEYWNYNLRMTDCAWSARAAGWRSLMDKIDEEKEASNDI